MGLSDFERELAKDKKLSSTDKGSGHENNKSRHHHRHHSRRKDGDDSHRRDRSQRHDDDESRRRHRSHREDDSHHRHRSHREGDKDEDRRRRHKRRHEEDEGDDKARERRQEKRRRSLSPLSNHDGQTRDVRAQDDEAIGYVEPDRETFVDSVTAPSKSVERDAWMCSPPTAKDIEVVASRRPKTPPGRFVGSKGAHGLEASRKDTKSAIDDLRRDLMSDGEDEVPEGDNTYLETDLPAQHDVDYVFGDAGSEWRMTKLRAVYRQAEESGRNIDDVAIQQYGNLRNFDDAREEEREIGRRRTLGSDFVGLEKPSGELFQERKLEEKQSRTQRQGKKARRSTRTRRFARKHLKFTTASA